MGPIPSAKFHSKTPVSLIIDNSSSTRRKMRNWVNKLDFTMMNSPMGYATCFWGNEKLTVHTVLSRVKIFWRRCTTMCVDDLRFTSHVGRFSWAQFTWIYRRDSVALNKWFRHPFWNRVWPTPRIWICTKVHLHIIRTGRLSYQSSSLWLHAVKNNTRNIWKP